jgi:hypothetical protein
MNKSINQSINHGCRVEQYSVSVLVRAVINVGGAGLRTTELT